MKTVTDMPSETSTNNPFCEACKESDCVISLDGTCAMIRRYLDAVENEKKVERLTKALHDAINRPTGVVPDSATGFYDQDFYDKKK